MSQVITPAAEVENDKGSLVWGLMALVLAVLAIMDWTTGFAGGYMVIILFIHGGLLILGDKTAEKLVGMLSFLGLILLIVNML